MRISNWSSDVCSSDLEEDIEDDRLLVRHARVDRHGDAAAAADPQPGAGQLARRKGDAERADGEVGAAHAEDDASEQKGEDDAADRGRPHAQREAIEELAVVEPELLAAERRGVGAADGKQADLDRKSTRLNSSH